MKNQELQELSESIISTVEAVGIHDSVMLEAKYAKYRSAKPGFTGYLVSIFHSVHQIHQYTKLTAEEALAEARAFAEKYKAGGFDLPVNTYKEEEAQQCLMPGSSDGVPAFNKIIS